MRKALKMGAVAVVSLGLYASCRHIHGRLASARFLSRLQRRSRLAMPVNQSIRIVSFGTAHAAHGVNTYTGREMHSCSAFHIRENLVGIRGILTSLKPDIALLQDVDTFESSSSGFSRCGVDELSFYRRLFPDFSESFTDTGKPSGRKSGSWMRAVTEGESGLALFSRYDVQSSERKMFPGSFIHGLVGDISRGYNVSEFVLSNGKRLYLYHVDLGGSRMDKAFQVQQFSALMQDVSAHISAGDYVICGGHFHFDLPGDSLCRFNDGLCRGCRCPQIPDGLLPEGLRYVAPDNPEVPTMLLLRSRVRFARYMRAVSDGFFVSQNISSFHAHHIHSRFLHSNQNPVVLDVVI